MNGVTILFYFFIILAGVSAGAIVFSKNVFKSALFLLVSLLSVAALYVLSFAEFLAVAQILIYAGGILVIIIFGIMLTTKISGRPLVVENTHILSGGIAGISLFILLTRFLPSLPSGATSGLQPEDIRVIGLAIFSRYPVPFEVAGLLLLIALVGAAVVTSHLKSKA
ncbi:MAG: NADH-quinone oxidoreductase subunit J [Cyclobacteriaceae bacterium]